MKNRLFTGLCFFFILFSLFLLSAPAAVSAQSGHGGSTEVIAHIEPEPTTVSEETQPSPTQPVSGGDQPIQTGEVIARVAVILLSAAGMTLMALRFLLLRNKKT